MALAWSVDATIGWPNWLFERVRHPVVWIGTLISGLERKLNQTQSSHTSRYISGAVSSLIVISIVTSLACLISLALPNTPFGVAYEALIASSLLASRSLYTHVEAVAKPLSAEDVSAARTAVSMIVGRDPNHLDEPGIARAGLESLAENASDGIIAPLFWGALFGLPGLAAYKAINTLDSMIGHKTEKYGAFGGFAARLDDAANFVPARLTAALIALASFKPAAFLVPLRDATRHRSPNAGWPEAAMAGALGVRLSGPRQYGETHQSEPWLNASAPDPGPATLKRGLALYVRAMGLAAALLALGLLSVPL